MPFTLILQLFLLILQLATARLAAAKTFFINQGTGLIHCCSVSADTKKARLEELTESQDQFADSTAGWSLCMPLFIDIRKKLQKTDSLSILSPFVQLLLCWTFCCRVSASSNLM